LERLRANTDTRTRSKRAIIAQGVGPGLGIVVSSEVMDGGYAFGRKTWVKC
jgi:hypothetical protein